MQALNRMVALMWIVAAVFFACSQGEENHCRCTNPNAACWPTSEHWNAFNLSINGRLIAPTPTGSSCHDPHYNATECQATQENQTNAYMRAANPGSMQNENWEEFEEGERIITCSMHAPQSSKCHQGRVPALGVQVEAVQDVQRAIRFVTKHNLRVVVKTSGHDLLGRSTAGGSLLIWMRKLRSISIHELWTGSCGVDHVHAAITVMGGVSWGEVYERVNSTDWVVVGGMSLTVGATGGFVQGGGHSALSPSFGLAVDNVLEMEVVTADGALRVASACQEPDLFFALRGGGGGTFGVVTSVTYKLHKRPKSFLSAQLQLNAPEGEAWTSATQEEILTAISRATVPLDAVKWAGYWYSSSLLFSGTFVVPGAETDSTFTSLVDILSQIENVTVFMKTTRYSTFLAWHTAFYDRVYPETHTDTTGAHLLLGSRIIPFSALESPRHLAKTIVALETGVLGHMVIGPGVRTGDPEKHTSVTPAWRAGVWHLVTSATWRWNATDGEARVQTERFSDKLQNAFPGSGAYVNEACTEEHDWARSFWGENYARLLATKVRVDPRGVFVCRQCVGSELWSEDGNCRPEALIHRH